MSPALGSNCSSIAENQKKSNICDNHNMVHFLSVTLFLHTTSRDTYRKKHDMLNLVRVAPHLLPRLLKLSELATACST